MHRNLLISLNVLFALIVIGLVLGKPSILARAQAAPTPTETPNPTITALEGRVKSLETAVAFQEVRKDVDKQSLENDVQKQLLPVYIWAAILSALGISSAVGVWIWIKSWIEKTKKQVEEETRSKLDRAFYNADPLYYPLYLPANGFETETRRLRRLGFKDLREYTGLRAGILDGIVIVRIPGENYSKNQQDQKNAASALKTFEEFITEKDNAERKLAFVLYISGGYLPEANDLAARYDNVVIANMPVTIAEHVYALVRGLTALEKPEKEVK